MHAAACERNLLQQNAMGWITEQAKLRECVRHATHAAKATITAYKRKSSDITELVFKSIVNTGFILRVSK